MTGRRARYVWRHHDFRWLATGQGLSWLGDAFLPVALAVGVLGHGGRAADLGIVLATGMAARLVCMLAGGVWADRLPPQRIMVAADLVRLLASVGLAVQFARGSWSVWSVAALMAVAMAAGAFFLPAFTSLKPNLVPEAERQRANGTLTMLQTGAQLAGPAAAGVLVGLWGAPVGFAINAASFVVSAVCVTRVRVAPERAARAGFVRELRGGLDAITSRPWLRAGILGATAYHLANGVVLVLVPVVALRELGGAHAVGLVESAAGLGGLLGGAVGVRIRVRRPLVTAWTVLVVLPVGLLTYVWPGVLWAVLAGTAAGFCGLMLMDVLWETVVQAQVSRHELARVASWDALASWVMIPLGNALAGPLIVHLGTRTTMTACAVWMALAALTPLLTHETWRMTTRRPADTEARATTRAPA
ncbi:MFS transporter [Luteipulveratus sp. YIM 133132]|uniref:MFS transporter n=1 Tax=Luteipulveratus flavus TaxID=3031728 RepID=UPI0023AF51D3|nr:MFS transporter [Luteipulveratus sp. YIM 133132]MDE9367867.1 MFS transporter [Luteipulveratus sp. YIM 133132]